MITLRMRPTRGVGSSHCKGAYPFRVLHSWQPLQNIMFLSGQWAHALVQGVAAEGRIAAREEADLQRGAFVRACKHCPLMGHNSPHAARVGTDCGCGRLTSTQREVACVASVGEHVERMLMPEFQRLVTGAWIREAGCSHVRVGIQLSEWAIDDFADKTADTLGQR